MTRSGPVPPSPPPILQAPAAAGHTDEQGIPAGDPVGPRRVVAVDGPSGSGKSTVARRVAQQLGWRYVDTGATYRAATLAVLEAEADPSDADAVLSAVRRRHISLGTHPDRPAVQLDGVDVSAAVRGAAVTAAVSQVSSHPALRELLVALQRTLMGEDGAVAEGRDVGTAVAPYAALKVFLDADASVRAGRRAAEPQAGVYVSDPRDLVASVRADLARRDAYDSSRTVSPLVAATDAVHLDATFLTVEQVAARVLELAERVGVRRSR